MGNQTNSPLNSQTLSIKRLTQQADKLSNSLQLDSYSASVIRRIFVQKNQNHLIQIIKHKKSLQQIQLFLDQIHIANIQILDSFYQHIVKNWFNVGQKQDQIVMKKNIVMPFDREIGICGSMDIMSSASWQNISEKYADIIDLTKPINNNIQQYEMYKQKGLQAIRNQQVCFIILAGGKNIRYDLLQYKECDILTQLPSQSCLIQLILKKLQALGKIIDTTIHISIMVDNQQHKKKIRKIKSIKIPNPEYIQVDFITQINYGCLDIKGKLVIDDNQQVYLHPNGNGDIWGSFQGKNYQKNRFNQFKYFQIFGVSNMLEHCFDCFMIGKAVVQKVPWITMAKYNLNPTDKQPVIFINTDKKIHVRDPQQIGCGMDINNLSHFPKKCPHIFLNNTVFSSQFIQKAVNQKKWLQYRKYHCKYKKIDHRTPLSKYSSIITFQRQITDIFGITQLISQQKININNIQNIGNSGKKNNNKYVRKQDNKMKKKGTILLMNSIQYHSSFYTKYDKCVGIVSLSQMYKKWLKITNNNGNNNNQDNQQKDRDYYEQKIKQICQIDPSISIQGQNLQQTIQQLSNMPGDLQYPIYIGPQNNELQTNNTINTIKQSKFAYLSALTQKI